MNPYTGPVTLTLSNLPSHTAVSVGFSATLANYTDTPPRTVSISAGGASAEDLVELMDASEARGVGGSFMTSSSTVAITLDVELNGSEAWNLYGVSAGVHFNTVTISGGGDTVEGGAAVPLTVSRDNDPVLLAQDLHVELEVTGDTTGLFTQPIPDVVTIPGGLTSQTFSRSPVDNTVTASPKGEVAKRTLVVGIQPNDWYKVVPPGNVTIRVADDPTWFYTPWTLVSKPDVMQTPVTFLGEYQTPIETDPHTGAQGYDVVKYYYYDKFEPLHGGEVSNSFGAAVNLSVGVEFGEAESWTAEVGLTVDGLPVNPSMTLSWTKENTTVTGTNAQFPPVAAGADEKVWVIPLVQKRYIIREVHSYYRPGSGPWSVSVSTTTSWGYTGDVDCAIYKFKRFWLDEEDPDAAGKTRTPPGTIDLNTLLYGS